MNGQEGNACMGSRIESVRRDVWSAGMWCVLVSWVFGDVRFVL